jgi:CS domain
MSKLSDYSKFDQIDSDVDDSDTEEAATKTSIATVPQQSPPPPSNVALIRKHPTIENRFIFEHNQQAIYEWEQKLSEVILYVPAPPITHDERIVCHISANHLQLGLDGADRFFLDEDTYSKVDMNESTWCIEDDDHDNNQSRKLIVIYFQKAAKGMVWLSALTSARFDAQLNPVDQQEVQQRLLLERWQEENPGMDFRDAKFNGSAPDPRTFMGGVSYD